MKTVKGYIDKYFSVNQRRLENSYPGINTRLLVEAFCDYTQLNQSEVYLFQGQSFFSYLDTAYPLEYILKKSYFYRSDFYVNEDVLIPRSETEILVENSIEYIKKNYHSKFRVAEIGTGSFCIGLSILIDTAKPLYFWGGDISHDALDVSRVNYFRLQNKISKNSKVDLVLSDRLEKSEGLFDLIVSNPPYIKEIGDAFGVHAQTHQFEPHIALYLKDDEYNQWFELLFEQVLQKLTDNGAFFMEGHEDALLHLSEIAKKYFKEVNIIKDYTNRERFLYCYK